MKITGLKSMKIQGVPWTWTLIKVETDEGVCGIGEAQLPIVRDILPIIEKTLIGQDPRQVIPLAHRIHRSLSGYGSSGGSIVVALSGVELALWDLHGKITGLPLWQLLGGKYRDRVRMYADTARPGDRSPAAYAEGVQERVEAGYTVVKVDIDHSAPPDYRVDPHNRALSRREVDYMSAVSHAAFEALPDHVELCLDMHWAYQAADALRVARRLEDIDVLWLEDPTPPEDLESLKHVTDNTSVPIACGENHWMSYGLRPMVERRAADIITPDIPRFGGIQEGKKVAEMCEQHSLGFAPHNICTPVGTVASAHVCANAPSFLALEHHGLDCPWWDDIAAGWGGPVIEAGYITVPDGPGIGVDLNEELLRAHLAPGESWWE
jgi:L-alanine-DL-glutamate epimerase-like enolase superfamily enzyme